MAAEVVVATLNVSFDSSSTTNGTLKLELDDRVDGLNGGETSFGPGEDAFYFIFKDSDVTVVEHIATAGGISDSGNGTKTINENVTFTNSDTGSLGYPPANTVSLSWMGRSYEVIGTQVKQNKELPEITRSELKMANGKKVIGILKCQYDTTGSLHKLSGVPKDFKESMIVAIGTVGV